jgi:hypothetical protein
MPASDPVAYQRAYRRDHRDHLNAQRRARYAANTEHERAVALAWRQQNAEKVAQQNRDRNARRDRLKDRQTWLMTKHGMTLDDYEMMWLNQEGRCYLCGDELVIETGNMPGGQRLPPIEHDHRCCPPGRSCSRCQRGLSCSRCNLVVGHALDDPARLHRIAENLEVALSRLATWDDDTMMSQLHASSEPLVVLDEVRAAG